MRGASSAALEAAPLSPAFSRLGAPRPEPFEAWHVLAAFIVRHLNFASWQKKLWNARVVAALGVEGLEHFHLGRQPVPLIVPSGVVEMVGSKLPDLPAEWVAALQPLGLSLSGSNCWAVSGDRTATGHPLIAGDPHRALEAPNVYHQIGLRCPDEGIDAAGIAFPGIPGFPHFGQNAAVAWGVTNAIADYQDLFIERLDDQSTVLDRRTERVQVRDGEAVEVECLVTRHGPVVVGGPGRGGGPPTGLALCAHELTDAGGSLRSILPQLRSRTLDELDAALAGWIEPVNNFVLADRRDIGYRTAGAIPIRSAANAWLPVPGWVTDHDWQGRIPDEQLPRQRRPSTGLVITANQQITGSDHPHLIHVNPESPDRAARIWSRLEDRSGLTVRDQADVHLDTVHRAGQRFAELAGGRLAGWDGSMDAASTQAALFALAEAALVRRLTDALPAALSVNPFAADEPPVTAAASIVKVGTYVHEWILADDRWLLPPDTTWADACRDALAAAEAELGGRTWGDLHRLSPLRLGEGGHLRLGPVAGADGCVMATMHVAGVTTDAVLGSTARYVWDLGDRRNSGWIVPLGASEFDDSPHATDQTALYTDGRLIAAFPMTAFPMTHGG